MVTVWWCCEHGTATRWRTHEDTAPRVHASVYDTWMGHEGAGNGAISACGECSGTHKWPNGVATACCVAANV